MTLLLQFMYDLRLQNSFIVRGASGPNSLHIELCPPVNILVPLGKNWMQSHRSSCSWCCMCAPVCVNLQPKWNNFIKRPSPKQSPLLLRPKDPMIPLHAPPNFCGSFLSNIFETRMVPF